MGRAVNQLLCCMLIADSFSKPDINPQDGEGDNSPSTDRCPSYCDSDGRRQDGKRCMNPAPFCCKTFDGDRLRLTCCSNESIRIDDDSSDNYDCDSKGSVMIDLFM